MAEKMFPGMSPKDGRGGERRSHGQGEGSKRPSHLGDCPTQGEHSTANDGCDDVGSRGAPRTLAVAFSAGDFHRAKCRELGRNCLFDDFQDTSPSGFLHFFVHASQNDCLPTSVSPCCHGVDSNGHASISNSLLVFHTWPSLTTIYFPHNCR